MNWSNYECEGQMSIFDLLSQDFPETAPVETIDATKEFEEILKRGLLKYGTGCTDGKVRVHKILQRDLPDKEKMAQIKSAFGLGGFSSRAKEGEHEIYSLSTFNGALDINYTDSEGEKEASLSWQQVYKFLKKWNDAGEYFKSSFYPEDIVVEKHYVCNGAVYLKVADEAKIYNLPQMVEKNLYVVYTKKDNFSLVSVVGAKAEMYELTDDEQKVVSRVGYDYAYSLCGLGLLREAKK